MKEKQGRPGLSQAIKDSIISHRKAGETYTYIARKYGIHPQTVYVVCKKAGIVPEGKIQRDASKRVIGTLKQTIERLVREVQANEQRNADLVRQLDELQELFNKEKSKTWLDRLIGF
jgi:transposase-like protein